MLVNPRRRHVEVNRPSPALVEARGRFAACHGREPSANVDDKKNGLLVISRNIVDRRLGGKMQYPAPSASRLRELRSIRRQLAKSS